MCDKLKRINLADIDFDIVEENGVSTFSDPICCNIGVYITDMDAYRRDLEDKFGLPHGSISFYKDGLFLEFQMLNMDCTTAISTVLNIIKLADVGAVVQEIELKTVLRRSEDE